MHEKDRSYFAGVAPDWAVTLMRSDATFWSTWLCLDNVHAQRVLYELELAAMKWDVELKLYVTRTQFEDADLTWPAYVVTARALETQWSQVTHEQPAA